MLTSELFTEIKTDTDEKYFHNSLSLLYRLLYLNNLMMEKSLKEITLKNKELIEVSIHVPHEEEERLYSDQSYAQKVFDKCIIAGLGSPKFVDASTSAFPGWTNEMTLLLLDSLSSNYKLYKTMPLRDQAYRNIVEDFSNKGFIISREEIKRKWGNLLGTYRRIRDRPKKPGGCKSLWPYYYQIEHIIGTIRERSPDPLGYIDSIETIRDRSPQPGTSCSSELPLIVDSCSSELPLIDDSSPVTPSSISAYGQTIFNKRRTKESDDPPPLKRKKVKNYSDSIDKYIEMQRQSMKELTDVVLEVGNSITSALNRIATAVENISRDTGEPN